MRPDSVHVRRLGTEIAATVAKLCREQGEWFYATVTEVTPDLMVLRDSDTSSGVSQPVAAYCAGYSPTLNDRVLCLHLRRETVIVDELIAT
jgi:hypothetical protein